MPRKLRKRVYTYGQLDTILHRRGQWGCELDMLHRKVKPSKLYARLYGNLFITCEASPSMLIEYLTNRPAGRWPLAEVRLLANGDTGYLLPNHTEGVGLRVMSRSGKQKWKRVAAAFTPYEPGDPTGKWGRCMYRVRPNGEVIRLGVDATWPHYFVSLPKSIVPSPDRWIEIAGVRELHLPNYERRLKLFATRLRKILADGPRADMQLAIAPGGCNWFGHTSYGQDASTGAAAVRVALPPRDNERAKLLWVWGYHHTPESRRHFHIDGDYAIAHTQFAAAEGLPDEYHSSNWRPPNPWKGGWMKWNGIQRWKCATDAVIGVKEWVMSQLYIPGI